MDQLRIAVCDDVWEDASALETMIYEILPGTDIWICTSGETLLKKIEAKGNPFDAIFLDIGMAGKDGIETAREIRKLDETVPIIFVSNSDGYYREAFDVFAYQYLLKPVDKRMLAQIAGRLKGTRQKGEPALHFRYRAQIYTLRHSRIRYISSSLHTVIFHLSDGRDVQCRGKLSDFADQLEGSSFVRTHQSFFVNMDAVTSMKTDSILIDETMIPISRSFAKEVQERYAEYLKKGRKK